MTTSIRRPSPRRLLATVALAVIAAACTAAQPDVDAGHTGTADAGTVADAGADGGVDAGSGSGSDAGSAGTSDAGCLGSALLASLGKTKLLVGGSFEDDTAAKAPF